MAKSRPPIELSLETLSNQSMDESSTISRFHRSIVGLSSITQQRYVFCAQFNRSFCSKEQASKPTTRIQDNWTAKRDFSNRNWASLLRILSLRLYHIRDRFSVHQFAQSIGFRQETIGQPHRTRIQDDWAVKTPNRQSKMHELNLGQSSILAVRRHLAASSWAGNLGGPVKMIFYYFFSREIVFE